METKMDYLNQILQKRIDDKLQVLNSFRPLPASQVAKLQEQFKIEMTYNSNGIEGNSLTLKETFLVINEGLTIKGKPLKDHLEAKDHFEALKYLSDLIEHDKRHTVSEVLIRQLHQLVVSETDREWAGKYRNANVIISGSDHTPPDAIEVPKKMRSLVEWVKNNQKKLHPIELASMAHHKIVHIHPFFDGNGRTARLVMNLFLMQAGYPLVIILKNDRKKYYSVLDKADKGDYMPLIGFVAQSVERSLNIYLQIVTPKYHHKENFLPLAEISSNTPFSAKYLNLLIRQGKLEAYKKGRNWLTSKKAIDEYLTNRQRQRKTNKANK